MEIEKVVLPIGPLMIEHRLIERMITVMKKELDRIQEQGNADPKFIETAVNFIRIYADACHHGKEEKILFRDLQKKEMKPEDKQTMEELIEEPDQSQTLLLQCFMVICLIRLRIAGHFKTIRCYRFFLRIWKGKGYDGLAAME